MPEATVRRTLVVALAVCIVCSLLVTTAEVSLREFRYKNKKLDRIGNILTAAGIPANRLSAGRMYAERVRPVLVDLLSGKPVPQSAFNDVLNIDGFDIKKLSRHPEYGMIIAPEADISGLRRVPAFMPVYFILEDGVVTSIVLPIYGHGIWSTIYGFIALDRDLTTVRGFTIYEHGETPGLGGEVDNPRWKSTWKGKQAFDAAGRLRIRVIKGAVDPSQPDAAHQIEGLSGATLTTHGVDKMVRFWLGENGYSALLNGLREDFDGYL
jgi:Na+-transporting NADH:ubiquinone oxidoreductase subunit C